MLKILHYLMIGVISCFNFVCAQDAEFSQYFANPLNLNPALAGNKMCPRITFNYRNQWPSIANGFITYTASYDMYMEKLHGGIGFSFMNDRAGQAYRSTAFSGIYNYGLNISSKVEINAAMQVTYQQNTLDWDKLVFADQIDTRQGVIIPETAEDKPDRLSKGFPDFSTGITVGYDKSMYWGVAVHHLSQPDISFYGKSALDIKITAHWGALFDLQKESSEGNTEHQTSLSPNILYQQQGKFHQLNMGCYLNKYPFTGGVWYRNNFENSDAIIAMLGLSFLDFKIGYSYDYSISRLAKVSGGSHELSLAWQLPRFEKQHKLHQLEVPNF